MLKSKLVLAAALVIASTSAFAGNVQIKEFVCHTSPRSGSVTIRANANDYLWYKLPILKIRVYDREYKDPDSRKKLTGHLDHLFTTGTSITLHLKRSLTTDAQVYIGTTDESLHRIYQCSDASYQDL